MKEVSPDNDVLKSSVFHRLLQRAFPAWYPYDSISFFHPFYRPQTNAKYAQDQGYAKGFKMSASVKEFDVEASQPLKPQKPANLSDYNAIKALLDTGADEIVHPAFADPANLPPKVWEAINTIKVKGSGSIKESPENVNLTKQYFAQQMRSIVEREVITMQKGSKGVEWIYQLDITRE